MTKLKFHNQHLLKFDRFRMGIGRDIVNGLSIVGQKGQGDGYGIGAKESYTILDLCDMMKLNPRMTKFVNKF